MIKLAFPDSCTACGACAYRCPKNCISMQEDNIRQLYPIIDTNYCVDCHACENVCPVLHEPKGNLPFESYAAWSLDEEQRQTSASGGVAYEFYKHALKMGYKCVGASFNDDFSVTLKVAETEEELLPFKNSKYVFSDAYDVFPKIQKLLQQGEWILMMGLPCQIAAARKIYKNHENLLLVEILCHGTAPYSYLNQHIKVIEKQQGRRARAMSFRAPEYNTYTYTFTLYDECGKCMHAAKVSEDSYQYGYHRGVTYRESCYHCAFAKSERVGDIVLCDYYGLGKDYPCSYNFRNVSCILVNTEKGKDFVDNVKNSGTLFWEKRFVEEAVKGNPRLIKPNPKTKDRLAFEKRIRECQGNFEEAIAPLFEKYKKRENEPVYMKRYRAWMSRIKKMIR